MILFLKALRDILSGPLIVPLLVVNAIDAKDNMDEKRKKGNSKVTNKQKRVLEELTDFLNTDPAADVQLKRIRPDSDFESLPDDPKSKKKGTKAKPKKGGGSIFINIK